ncbi:MAG: hypothetical protein JKY37_28815 [Nannocystaceae bacterium]|nr:hypothetical protein [Nannocystaceae bacterium]
MLSLNLVTERMGVARLPHGLRSTVPSQLAVVDASDPTNPSEAGSLSIDEDSCSNWNPGDLLVSGSH